MFSGEHPLLQQAFHPMTIRFAILQSHYRSTFDFSNDALLSAERGLKRLWEAYEWLQALRVESTWTATDEDLDQRLSENLVEFDSFMNDDFSTAKIIANMFEWVPVMNSVKDKHIRLETLSSDTWKQAIQKMKTYLEDIFGLQSIQAKQDGKFDQVMSLLMDLRKEAKAKKDFATSDKIRQHLQEMGVMLKDEKDGGMSYSLQ
jgi:cysteinyl-tRNA synthetase